MVQSVTSYRRTPAQWRALARRIQSGQKPTVSEWRKTLAEFEHDLTIAESSNMVFALAAVILAADESDLRDTLVELRQSVKRGRVVREFTRRKHERHNERDRTQTENEDR